VLGVDFSTYLLSLGDKTRTRRSLPPEKKSIPLFIGALNVDTGPPMTRQPLTSATSLKKDILTPPESYITVAQFC
jgi:hypothetical protein